MRLKDKRSILQRDQEIFQRARVRSGLVWIAFAPCVLLAGCGAPSGATSGEDTTARTEQALDSGADPAVYVLGKCLDVPGANDANGTIVQIYDCNGASNQQWQFWSDGTIHPSFNTNKCLDLPAADTSNGNPIQIYDCNGGSNQQWTLGSSGQLRGYGGKCVDVPGAQRTSGTTLQYYDCNSGPNQMFMRAPSVAGSSQFWNLKAEEENLDADAAMCMGIAGGVQSGGVVNYGTHVIVWNCNGSPDQEWTRTFQTDPSGQSGEVDLVDGVPAHFFDSNDAGYPVCLWGYHGTPAEGEQLEAQYCHDLLAAHEDLIMNYVVNDAYGYPCFTLQNPETGLYVGVANAQANPVQNGMSVIMWERTESDDQVWCDHSANTESLTVIPDFVVTSVIYAPPGKASSMQYQSSTTVGSSTTTTKSFQRSEDVTASVQVGNMATPGMASASVSYDHTFSDSDTKQVDLSTTWTQGYKKPGETDGIDHDWDEIWFMVHPLLNVSYSPGINTNWEFGQGDGVNTGILFWAYAGELNGDMPVDQQLQMIFDEAHITPDMYPAILDADPFFQGISPQQGMDTARFDYLGEFPYRPPAQPLGQGQMPSTQPYSVSQSTSTSHTTTTSYSNSVGVTVSGSYNFTKLFKASLSLSAKWTWTHSSSQKDSSGSGSVDTLTVAQPPYGYTGPGLLHVYEDRIFKTYAFTLDYVGDIPFTDDGSTGCDVGGVWMHCCPPGNAMVGARLDQNVFKCAQLQDASGEIVPDFSTYREVNAVNLDGTFTTYSMHACPFGYVMVGYHQDMDVLACQKIPANTLSNAITGELVDTGTQDGYMHTCESAPYAYAMSGIDPWNNLLVCATSPGLK